MKRKLVIDIGNTLAKAALFEDRVLKELWSYPADAFEELIFRVHGQRPFDASVLSAVRDYPMALRMVLSESSSFIELDEHTGVPLKNLYRSPASLGKDRLAAACGAWSLHPACSSLVVSAGTCITYDVVTEAGEYLGGSISPGVMMRLKALHTFTGRLPLLSPEPSGTLPGRDTRESILTGVMRGAAEEIAGLCAGYEKAFPGIRLLLSGGDAPLFENQLKSGIFAVPNIVLLGLNEILDYHAHTNIP